MFLRKPKFGTSSLLARMLVVLICGVIFSVHISSSATAQTQSKSGRPSVDEITAYFETIVFGSEFGNIAIKKDVVSRWSGEVGISIQGRATDDLAGMASVHLKTLSKITGIRFRQVKSTDQVQAINLIFLKRSEMGAINGPGIDPKVVEILAMSGGCYYMAFNKPPERIVKAIVVVNIERPREFTNSCLLEELTQVMGLHNDSNLLRPSIFSDSDHLTRLSRSDEILVRTLYDPRLRPGTRKGKAMRQVRDIIADWDQKLPR